MVTNSISVNVNDAMPKTEFVIGVRVTGLRLLRLRLWAIATLMAIARCIAPVNTKFTVLESDETEES